MQRGTDSVRETEFSRARSINIQIRFSTKKGRKGETSGGKAVVKICWRNRNFVIFRGRKVK